MHRECGGGHNEDKSKGTPNIILESRLLHSKHTHSDYITTFVELRVPEREVLPPLPLF